MRGLYLMTKLELLISFYLLRPLWAALAWVLDKVGGAGDWGCMPCLLLLGSFSLIITDVQSS